MAVPPEARFCDECGTPLGPAEVQGLGAEASTGATSAPERGTERRLVSVLFADLVGFTTLSESRDSEEVRDLLSRYFDTCRTVVERYGGTVEKFIGDAVMALWGAPIAQEDDAERTVRAALDLVEAVAALGTDVGAPDLRARAGVLTGEATVNLAAKGEGMVAGDLVNTASRIQSAAEPGAVYVGEATKHATESAVAYSDAGMHELKGKAELLQLWRARRVVAGVGGALKSEGLEAPFVGRDRELRVVKDLFHDADDGGRAHLVSIVGAAGIGKSRLSWEFYKYMDGLTNLYRWHRGRCLSYGEGVAYWALAEMVRGRAEIVEGEEPSSAQAKLHATVERYVTDPEERRWVEPRLAHLLGLEERGVREKEDLFAGWRLFFERMAEERPVVMSFEDCQWADASLLDFVDYLLDWSRNHPIFVIASARPELLERRPTWGAGRRNFTSLYLEPLAADAMADLLEGLVPGLPEDVRTDILARAEGIPLYAVETVRMLLDRGLLVREGSVYRPAGSLGSLAIPETLHALIAARIDGLSPEERRLVQDASVLGKTFTRQAIAALSEQTEPDLDISLATLVRKEVLAIQSDPRSPERGQYGFLQDLMRRVAYETLSRRDRKAKHLVVASYLEDAWGAEEEEIVEVVAAHLADAYHLDREADDAMEIGLRARDMLIRAGERAASLGAHGEAERYFEQAAGLAEDATTRAGLLDRAGSAAWRRGDVETATRLFEAALEFFEAQEQARPAARVSVHLAEVEMSAGNLRRAIERMEGALDVLGDDEDEDVAEISARLGSACFFTGDTERAISLIARALQTAENLWLPEVLCRALTSKGTISLFQNRPEEAQGLYSHALKIALDNDIPDRAGLAYFNLSDAMFRRDRYSDALGYLRDALTLMRRIGDRLREMELLAEMTYPLYLTGRWDEAVETAGQIPEEQVRTAGTLLSLMNSVLEISIHRGDLDEARRLLSLNSERISDSADIQERACLDATRATVAVAEGDFAGGLAAGQDAMRSADVLGIASQAVKQGFIAVAEAAVASGDVPRASELAEMIMNLPRGRQPPFLLAQAFRLEARVADLREEADRVERGFKAAVGMFRELDTPFWLAVTMLEYAEWLTRQDRGDDATPLLNEARETFDRLGADPWARRLDAIQRPVRPVPAAP